MVRRWMEEQGSSFLDEKDRSRWIEVDSEVGPQEYFEPAEVAEDDVESKFEEVRC